MIQSIRTKLFFFLLLTAIYTNSIFSAVTKAVILVDADGVWLTQNQRSVIWEVGPSYFLGWYNPLKIQKNYFEFLDTIYVPQPHATRSIYQGNQLPQLMCDWLAGVRTPEQIRDMVHAHLRARLAVGGHKQDQMFGAIADFMFTPDRFSKVITTVKKGVKLIKKCYMQRDEYGCRAHKIYLVTNWEAASFELLYSNRKIRKVLDMFDGVVISGEVHLLKPDPEIFRYTFAQFGIDPDRELVIYIDDEESHIRVARNLNRKIRCFHCKNFDLDAIAKDLKRLGIFG